MLGACPTQVPRDPRRVPFADNNRGDRARRRALRDRARHTRQPRGDAATRPPGQGKTAAREPARLDGIETRPALPQVRRAAAIRYALSRWRALTRYTDDGRLEIDNNAAERALRVVAMGRKNYLFAGSDAGGERAAAIYSLLGSAKLNGLDPELYLQHVLERVADHPINRIHELLPWNAPLTPTHS